MGFYIQVLNYKLICIRGQAVIARRPYEGYLNDKGEI
jgi:hypothetical protein